MRVARRAVRIELSLETTGKNEFFCSAGSVLSLVAKAAYLSHVMGCIGFETKLCRTRRLRPIGGAA